MQIDHWDESRDGVLNEANMSDKLEDQGYSVSRYGYPPGTFFPEHEHAVDKIIGVLAGRLRITLRGGEAIMEPGDCLSVPRGAMHSVEVVGDEPVISLDAMQFQT
jgi:quercetin dioxygenase-like cupin family protein